MVADPTKTASGECLIIAGGKPLEGRIQVSGAKNAVLKLMAAALMTEEPCTIRNVPNIRDVASMVEVLRGLGAEVEFDAESGMVVIQAKRLDHRAPAHVVRQMRASIQVMGPLLARLGRCRISQPGGCALGERPIDLHLTAFRRLGVELREVQGFIAGRAKRIVGHEVYFDRPSVGATENVMMAAALGEGETVIHNAAKEPEVVEVQRVLNRMGAKVRGAGTSIVRIEGVEELGGFDHTVIPDRIEAGTFVIAAAITGGDLRVEQVMPEHIETILEKVSEAGADVEVGDSTVRIRNGAGIWPLSVESQPYPGLPTDVQPQFTSLLALAQGTSVITETIYANRFKHAEQLRLMGADITVEGQRAVVRGVRRLSGSRVIAQDLRAGAALVLAGLAAKGTTVVEGLNHIDRGYERIEEKLAAAGADILRTTIQAASRRFADAGHSRIGAG